MNAAGIIAAVAGNGEPFGFGGDGGLGTDAELNEPAGVAFDAVGALYVADTANDVVRKVETTGRITMVAGGGDPNDGVSDGGPATAARLRSPSTEPATSISRRATAASAG